MLRQRKIYRNLAKFCQTSFRRYSNANNTSENHYETLGITPQASKEQIKKAYKELSKKYHPDVSTEPNAAERFKKINHAYSVLKDRDTRQNYDQQTHGYEKASTTTQQYTRKENTDNNGKTNESQQRASGAGGSSQNKTPEELLYEQIFGKSFKEDPMYYYKESNEPLRRKYEEELERLRNEDRTSSSRANKEAKGSSSKDEGFNSKEYAEDREEWIQFMNDIRRERGARGNAEASAAAAAAAAQYPQSGGFDSSALKWLWGGIACLSGMALYLLLRERQEKSGLQAQDGSILDLDNIRNKHLKRVEDKKEQKKVDFQNSLALMKKYPRRNPNAISMLVDYTFWNDLKIYHIPWTYFHGEDDNLCRFTRKFEKSRLFNVKMNAMVTLALESERCFKNVFVKIDDVLKSLKETGYYEAPGVFFRYYGYIYVRIRRKPINVESLKEHIQNGEKVISVYDLFEKYSTPILIANSEYYEIPLKHSSYVQDTTTREGLGWVGNAHINHRPLPKVVVNADEKNVFLWKATLPVTPLQERYLRTWGLHYDTYEKI